MSLSQLLGLGEKAAGHPTTQPMWETERLGSWLVPGPDVSGGRCLGPADHHLQFSQPRASLRVDRACPAEVAGGWVGAGGRRATGISCGRRRGKKKNKKNQATGSRTQAYRTPLCWLKQMSPEKHKPQRPTLVHGHSSGPCCPGTWSSQPLRRPHPGSPVNGPQPCLQVPSSQAPDTSLQGSLQMAQTMDLSSFVPQMAQ